MSIDAEFASDIPIDLAIRAHSGISFSPESRGQSAVMDYANTLAQDHEALLALAIQNSTADLLPTEFERYRDGYKKRFTQYLHANSRCVSWMIAGPSNFPVRRMEKRNAVVHRRLTDLIEFRERALSAIRKTLVPSARPIMTGDADASDRLKAKIEEAEREHAQMLAINTAHKKFVKNPESLETAGLNENEKNAVRNYKPAYSWEPHPFAPYQFQNSSANIRRMKERLEHITKIKSAAGFEAQGEHAKLCDCPDENRVKLFFDGKPSEEVRSRLKSCGFRWAPSEGCWKAYRNQGTYDFAKREAGCSEEVLKVAVYAARDKKNSEMQNEKGATV